MKVSGFGDCLEGHGEALPDFVFCVLALTIGILVKTFGVWGFQIWELP